LLALSGWGDLAPSAQAAAGDAVADRVLGQSTFTAAGANRVDARGLFLPQGVAIDGSASPPHLYVSDFENNRVLGWRDAAGFRDGAPADLVLGQPDFRSAACNAPFAGEGGGSPSARSLCLSSGREGQGVAVDGEGRVYVADGGNRRVLIYDPPFLTDTVADRVIGQGGDFTRNEACGFDDDRLVPGPEGICGPVGVALDRAGNLYVSDVSRVLEFDAPRTGDTLPDLILGRDLDNACRLSPPELCSEAPVGLTLDAAGDLFVSDVVRDRVLGYRSPRTTDVLPDAVWGAAAVTDRPDPSKRCADGPSYTGLCFPAALAVDSAGRLWVADLLHDRVVAFDAPFAGGALASVVLGRRWTRPASGSPCLEPAAADRLCQPAGLAFDPAGALYLSDGFHRVLRFAPPLAGGQSAEAVLGQGSPRFGGINRVDGRGLALPGSVAVDRSSRPNHLYVADNSNNRVLGWRDAAGFTDGAPADLVIGQPDFKTAGCNSGGRSARSLCFDAFGGVGGLYGQIAVDAGGRLFVADVDNHRVLELDPPFESDTAADRVYGQIDFAGGTCNLFGRTPASLCLPTGVAVDREGNLYISDSQNARVVAYRHARRDTRRADLVLGTGADVPNPTACALRSPDARSLCLPRGLATDAEGNLYVADMFWHRVLRFPHPLGGGLRSASADRVFGQGGSFTRAGCSRGDLGPEGLCGPQGVTISPGGDLLIADTANERVVRYRDPAGRARVDRIFGGILVPGGRTPVTAETLAFPVGVDFDRFGNLFVADLGHSRVLEFDRP
jgi:DNA-binding beta-propeller fold protein YncE